MQGLVTLDFGNSNPHAGLFSKNKNEWELLKVVPLAEISLYLSQFGMRPENTSLVLSEVKPRDEELLELQKQGYLVTRIKDYWRGKKFAGMLVDYSETLGEDRLINAYYRYKKEKIPTLIIDAGTFATLDVITCVGFAGGLIVPGVKAYFESFQKGEQLKDILPTQEILNQLPHDTKSAMRDGYYAFGALAKELMHKHGLQKIVLTGSSAEVWRSFLTSTECPWLVEVHPHLIHFSLQYWMTTQIEPL